MEQPLRIPDPELRIVSDYLEARTEAVRILDELETIRVEYQQRVTSPLPPGENPTQEEVSEWQKHRARDGQAIIERSEMTLREGVVALGNDPRLQTVIAAEVPLFQRVNMLANFWLWLQGNKLVAPEDEREMRVAKTVFPPTPDEVITGENVLTYMRALHLWLNEAADELWGEDNPIELPDLGNRYGIGDFNHTAAIVNTLQQGIGLQVHWSNLASCGAYWETLNIGAARAKLIYQGVSVLTSLIDPPR